MVSRMPPLSTLPLFAAASIALLILPGPAGLFIVARGGAQGRRLRARRYAEGGILTGLGLLALVIPHRNTN